MDSRGHAFCRGCFFNGDPQSMFHLAHTEERELFEFCASINVNTFSYNHCHASSSISFLSSFQISNCENAYLCQICYKQCELWLCFKARCQEINRSWDTTTTTSQEEMSDEVDPVVDVAVKMEPSISPEPDTDKDMNGENDHIMQERVSGDRVETTGEVPGTPNSIDYTSLVNQAQRLIFTGENLDVILRFLEHNSCCAVMKQNECSIRKVRGFVAPTKSVDPEEYSTSSSIVAHGTGNSRPGRVKICCKFCDYHAVDITKHETKHQSEYMRYLDIRKRAGSFLCLECPYASVHRQTLLEHEAAWHSADSRIGQSRKFLIKWPET